MGDAVLAIAAATTDGIPWNLRGEYHRDSGPHAHAVQRYLGGTLRDHVLGINRPQLKTSSAASAFAVLAKAWPNPSQGFWSLSVRQRIRYALDDL